MTDAAAPVSILQSRVQLAEYERQHWRVTAEEGTTLEDLLAPIFWAHVAHTFKRFDRIEVVADDETFFYELIVRDCARGYARVAVLNKIEFDGGSLVAPQSADGYRIEWKGPKRRHIIVREADNSVLKEDIPSKAQAVAWIEEHKRALAA